MNTHTQKINMKKIKISHEVPFCLLTKSREFNDYDYCLPHLMDENEEYRVFFLNSKNVARYIIMDNSLHELGEAYNSDRLMYWVNKLEPDEFIVPDVWEDYAASVRNAKQWATVKMPANTTKVAVVQAKSFHEALLCVQAYKDLGYKKIAFSYGASYYNDICPHPNKDLGKAIGRYMVIYELYKQIL
jgi:predicted aspartyl protease